MSVDVFMRTSMKNGAVLSLHDPNQLSQGFESFEGTISPMDDDPEIIYEE